MAVDIKLIATDLDGTLLCTDSDISDANVKALRTALAQGITVCIATGRSHESAANFARQLRIEESLIISYNGAMIRRCNEDTAIYHKPISPEFASAIVQQSVEESLHLNYYINDKLYVTHVDKWSWMYFRRTGDVSTPVGDLRQFNGSSPTKLLVCAEPPLIPDLLKREQAAWNGTLYVTRSMPEYIEYLNTEANKGAALRWLANHLGVGMECTMACGDQLNDLTMISEAGIGVAMPTACQEVRDGADFIAETQPEGVAEAICHYLAL